MNFFLKLLPMMEWLLLTETLRMDLVIRTTFFAGRVSISPWPVCAHASCARVGVFISNLPAGRAPRCPPRSGSYPMLSYQIML